MLVVRILHGCVSFAPSEGSFEAEIEYQADGGHVAGQQHQEVGVVLAWDDGDRVDAFTPTGGHGADVVLLLSADGIEMR